MALIHCVGCGQAISANADFCPNCGMKRVKDKKGIDIHDWISLTALSLAAAAFVLSINMKAVIEDDSKNPDDLSEYSAEDSIEESSEDNENGNLLWDLIGDEENIDALIDDLGDSKD